MDWGGVEERRSVDRVRGEKRGEREEREKRRDR